VRKNPRENPLPWLDAVSHPPQDTLQYSVPETIETSPWDQTMRVVAGIELRDILRGRLWVEPRDPTRPTLANSPTSRRITDAVDEIGI